MSWKLASRTAFALVLSATGAMAAVTPEEVWQSWQDLSTGAGQELTVGNTARTGDTLEVTGLIITFADDLGSTFSATFDKLSFKDNGDGTVTVAMPESYPVSLAFPADAGGPSSMKVTVSQPGLVILAGGSATETTYDFTAPTLTVVLDEVMDQSGAVLDTKATLSLSETTASYLVGTEGKTTRLDSSFASRSAAVNVSGQGTDGTGSGSLTLSLADLAGTTKGVFLGAEIMANMATALNSGFTSDTAFSFGAMAVNLDATDASGPIKLAGSATGGDFVLAVDKLRMNYGSSLKGASFTVSGAEIPFPEVVVAFGETAFNVLVPASKSESPQDFAFLTKMVDLTISEDVWSLFDPGATLSRDPATLILDVKGTGFWKQDIMDPEVQMDGATPPGELTALDLTQIIARAAGAEISATGGLTFDNADLATFDGLPAPSGSINITIKGVNALIDNLIAMGLLPDDQAMGARLMLGMFTRPGTAPDEVTSLVEFRDGGLFANGQQLQ